MSHFFGVEFGDFLNTFLSSPKTPEDHLRFLLQPHFTSPQKVQFLRIKARKVGFSTFDRNTPFDAPLSGKRRKEFPISFSVTFTSFLPPKCRFLLPLQWKAKTDMCLRNTCRPPVSLFLPDFLAPHFSAYVLSKKNCNSTPVPITLRRKGERGRRRTSQHVSWRTLAEYIYRLNSYCPISKTLFCDKM